jgi:gamma-glutamylcyclotransferase (GGCT)/AIG2-like uncharacterized protein YtfP
MKQYLFVCGTLMSEYVAGDVAEVMKRLQLIGAGSVRGRLYNLGPYPGAVIDNSATTSIHGELLRLPDDETTLAELDAYEDFNPTRPDDCLFIRKQTSVELVDGQTVDAWMYVYNLDPKDAPIIKSGKWSKNKVLRISDHSNQ